MLAEARSVTLKDGRVVTLRGMELGDAATFVEQRKRTCGETDYLALFAWEVDLTEEREREILARIIDSPRETMVGAFDADGQLLGTAGCGPVNRGAKYAHRAQCAIAIERAAWGAGLGTQLMGRVIELAREMGYEQLELGAYAENERAIALYRKLGFVAWGAIPRAFKHPDGSYHDEVQMVLRLDA